MREVEKRDLQMIRSQFGSDSFEIEQILHFFTLVLYGCSGSSLSCWFVLQWFTAVLGLLRYMTLIKQLGLVEE